MKYGITPNPCFSDCLCGNIVETTESMTRTYLNIRVSHKSPDEMAAQYGFTDAQKEQLHELLSEENKNMWNSVFHGLT